MELTIKQKGVFRNVIPAAVLTVVGLCGASLLLPLNILPLDEPGARIAWALKWALLPVLALMVSIQTNLLDTHPRIAVRSALRADEVLLVSVAGLTAREKVTSGR